MNLKPDKLLRWLENILPFCIASALTFAVCLFIGYLAKKSPEDIQADLRHEQLLGDILVAYGEAYRQTHNPPMKALIISSNAITLRDLPVGVFAEGANRNQKDRRSIYVKVELRAAGGNVLSTHVFDLLDPKDQYTDHINMDQTVNMIPPGSTINLLLP